MEKSEPDYSIYARVKQLANEKRILYGVTTRNIGLSLLRKIYKAEGIYLRHSTRPLKNLRAAYQSDHNDPCVLLNGDLPKEARIFSLAHELKHHYFDRTTTDDVSFCLRNYNEEPLVEMSAEVFAAEFIWPESEFYQDLATFGLNVATCSPENIVRFKTAYQVPVSYTFILKRLKRLRVVVDSSYDKVQFKKIEEAIYGIPFYRRGR